MSKNESSRKVKNLYLIPDFSSGNFNKSSLRASTKVIINKLVETNNLKYLVMLSTTRGLYQDNVFWKQVNFWQYLEFEFRNRNEIERLKEIEKIQNSVCDGFKKAIKAYKSSKRGRPSNELKQCNDQDLLKELIKLEDQISIHVLKPKTEVSNRTEELMIEETIKYLKRIKVFGKTINCLPSELNKVAKKKPSEIAIYLLAKALGVGIRKIKTTLAKINYAPQDDIIFKLPNGNERRVSWELFNKQRYEVIKEANIKKQKLSIDTIAKRLSRKLKIPHESIVKVFDSGVHVDLFSQTNKPHKLR